MLFKPGSTGQMSQEDAAQREKPSLDFSKDQGFPTIQAQDVVEVDDNYGIAQELIRNVLSSEQVIQSNGQCLPDDTKFNQRLADSCDDIISRLRETGIQIEDLQVLIDKAG